MWTYMTCIPGAPGAPGRDGAKGELGSPGKTGTQGPRGADGKKGEKGRAWDAGFCRTKRTARGQRRQWNATTGFTHELEGVCLEKTGRQRFRTDICKCRTSLCYILNALVSGQR